MNRRVTPLDYAHLAVDHHCHCAVHLWWRTHRKEHP